MTELDQRFRASVERTFKLGGPVPPLVHAAIGICGEAGELLDAIKKHAVYGSPLDWDNVVEELGDLEYYLCALRSFVAISRELTLERNMLKLARRYPKGCYTDEHALARLDKGDAE